MKPPNDCQQPAFHEMHLCILQHLNAGEAAKLSTTPEYRCLRCALQADAARNLCQPKKL
jgi:hypothetical protein